MRLTLGGGNPSIGLLAPSIGSAGVNDDDGPLLSLTDDGGGP